jgi:hypothetical protein
MPEKSKKINVLKIFLKKVFITGKNSSPFNVFVFKNVYKL